MRETRPMRETLIQVGCLTAAALLITASAPGGLSRQARGERHDEDTP